TPATTLLMRTWPWWITWSWPPAAPSVRIVAPSAWRFTIPTMSTWDSSSSSSSRNSGTVFKNSWIKVSPREAVSAALSSAFFERRLPARLHAAEQVAELLLLRLEIPTAGVGGRDLDREAFHDLEAVALEAHELARVVRQQPHLVHAQLVQDLGPDPVIALV